MANRFPHCSAEVQDLLALAEDGNRLIPLIASECASAEARRRLTPLDANRLFPDARSPLGALAGLWMYFSCFAESHAIAQDLKTQEGSYWHGILHRQEPDNWNAKYWFRQVGRHPVHLELQAAASKILQSNASSLRLPGSWDAAWFADLCDEAAADKAHLHRQVALEMQRAEWQLLFHWCSATR